MTIARRLLRQRLSSGHDLCDPRDKFSKHLHKMIAQTRFFKKNSTTHYQKDIFTWQKANTVHPPILSTLQSGRPQVQPHLHTWRTGHGHILNTYHHQEGISSLKASMTLQDQQLALLLTVLKCQIRSSTRLKDKGKLHTLLTYLFH